MTENALLEGRAAAERYAWSEALDLLARGDAHQSLGPDDLMLLADSAWWMGKMRDCIAARERAYTAYLEQGHRRRAAYVAVKLVDHHSDLAETGVAAAWMQTASKLLAGEDECVEHGYLSLMKTFNAEDLDGMTAAARETRRIGERFGDKDLMAFGLGIEGMALVQGGDVDR